MTDHVTYINPRDWPAFKAGPDGRHHRLKIEVSAPPPLEPGDRLYLATSQKVAGYIIVARITPAETGRAVIIEHDNALTPEGPKERVKSFKGCRMVWWPRSYNIKEGAAA